MRQLSACTLCFMLYQSSQQLSLDESNWSLEIERWTTDAIADNEECKRNAEIYVAVKGELDCLLNPVEQAAPTAPTLSLNWSE